eukprot:scaffold9250_cov27-Prasinocladus_malaysianus.AAC.1
MTHSHGGPGLLCGHHGRAQAAEQRKDGIERRVHARCRPRGPHALGLRLLFLLLVTSRRGPAALSHHQLPGRGLELLQQKGVQRRVAVEELKACEHARKECKRLPVSLPAGCLVHSVQTHITARLRAD